MKQVQLSSSWNEDTTVWEPDIASTHLQDVVQGEQNGKHNSNLDSFFFDGPLQKVYNSLLSNT